jgi:hypothetical protein
MRTVTWSVLITLILAAAACGSNDDTSGTGGSGGSAGTAGSGGAAGATGGNAGAAGSSDAGKTSETLAHHDGTSTGNFSPWVNAATDHSEIAVRFTPSSYPATLKTVRLRIANTVAGTDVPFDLRGYADGGTAPSDTVLFTVSPKPVAKDQLDDWLDVAVPDTEISSGSFWIGVQWDPAPVASNQGADSFFLRPDVALDAPDDHVVRGDSWITFTAAKFPIGDLLIEAIVEH